MSDANPDPTRGPDPAGTRACGYTEYERGEGADELPATGENATGLEADVWEVLYGIDDPEMPISIVDLGLIYGVAVEEGHARVDMTLTYTGCPARDRLTTEVEEAVAAVDGVESAELRLVWSPEWTLEMVTETGEERLREFGLSV